MSRIPGRGSRGYGPDPTAEQRGERDSRAQPRHAPSFSSPSSRHPQHPPPPSHVSGHAASPIAAFARGTRDDMRYASGDRSGHPNSDGSNGSEGDLFDQEGDYLPHERRHFPHPSPHAPPPPPQHQQRAVYHPRAQSYEIDYAEERDGNEEVREDEEGYDDVGYHGERYADAAVAAGAMDGTGGDHLAGDDDIDDEAEGMESEEDEEASRDEEGEVEVLSLDALTQRMKENMSVDVVGLGSGGSSAAAVWTVSSAKHSNGVTCLLDWGNTASYWQSDGPLPHTVTIQFQQLTVVETIGVLLRYIDDESYTPKVMSVRAGTHDGDMTEVASGTVVVPHGWVLLEVGGARGKGGGVVAEDDDHRVWCTRLEVVFVENHENGRDCHVRGIRVLGPSTVSAYTEPAFTQHLVLR